MLREMILQALDEQEGGGVEYLKRQAVSSPTAFMTILGKVLPMQIGGDPENPIKVDSTVEIVHVAAKHEG